MLVAECLTPLLFRFQWTFLYVPIVFTAALVCLDVPVPAIMGLHINKSNDNDDDDDGSSDTSDEATFEVQSCAVHIDKGEIQLPDDMPRFPDHLLKNDLKNKQRIEGNEDWAHVEDENLSQKLDDEPSQALARLSAIAKRAGIILNNKGLCLFNEFEIRQISANNYLRASFINRFAQLFSQMDAFICYPSSGEYSNVDPWLSEGSNRTMFIADQPKAHVPFFTCIYGNEYNDFFDITHKYLQI